MKIAHVRERRAPPERRGASPRRSTPTATRWLDLEDARRSLVAAASPTEPTTPPSSASRSRRSTRTSPRACASTRWPTCSRPSRRADGRIGPRLRSADPGAADLPRLLRLRAARRHDVEAPRHGDPRGVVPPADLLLQQRRRRSAGPATRCGRRAGRASSTTSSRSRALIDTPVRDLDAARGEEAIGGYLDPQRLERAGPPARGDDRPPRAGQGEGLRVLDRPVAGDARRAGRCAQRQRATIWR